MEGDNDVKIDNFELSDEETGPEDIGPVDLSPEKDGGVIKEILRKGKGFATPKSGDKVFVHYVGKLEDGTVFDSSRDRGQTFSFTLSQGQVIKGWDIAVASMKTSELAKFTIKSQYAYGAPGSPPKIPPNATLIFEIELFDWKMTDCTKKQDEGVRKRIIEHGEGHSSPNDGATVQVHLIGRHNKRVFEERDVTFIHGEPAEANIINGVDIGIGKMKKGEKAHIYIRKDYAWEGTPPPEYNLPPDYDEVVYEVHLNSFEKLKETWEMTKEEKLEQAKIAKDKGSNYFKTGKLDLALKQYKRIPQYLGSLKNDLADDSDIEMDDNKEDDPQDDGEVKSVLLAGHLNLAMVYLKMSDYLKTITNCNAALEIDPKNAKGLFRRGVAYYHVQEFEKAINDFENLISIEPDNKAAKNQLMISRHGLKQQKDKEKALFQRMISSYLKVSSNEKQDAGQFDDSIEAVHFDGVQKPEVKPQLEEVS